MNCKFCGNEIQNGKQGYLAYLDDGEQTRLNQLKLRTGENLCIPCKQEILFSGLDMVLS